ncbi:MAG: transferase [Thermodesulfovibrio sp.]|nr:transferase [Thermodesulfovibrio sp.]
MLARQLGRAWERFWMRYAGRGICGRIATYLAAAASPPYKGRRHLAFMNKKGYISPQASIRHDNLRLGNHVFIGDRVVVYKGQGGGPVDIGSGAAIHNDVIIEVGAGGGLVIGGDTHIQPRCQFSAYKGSIMIGCGVQIAPNCGFYPYNHGFAADALIKEQPLQSKGDIIVADDAWLGFGVIVLDNVRIGRGAVIGAGSVVAHDIPDGAIAVGSPAHVVRLRGKRECVAEGAI